ncbi:MAG: glycoside hydrolase family 3 C-terminal domain-containing protein, partial [Clostridiales bacterium]|nr:glycoside hydrolase family 3 C-terminal domain-containing protein [Clostridiales bacterium]
MMKTRTFSGTKDPNIQAHETAHRAIARKAAADSIVLLKNEQSLLPISTDKPIALYGAGATHTVKGGTGSGDVNERYSVSIADGLEQAGYRMTTRDWLTEYDRQFTEAREQWKASIWEETERRSGGTDAFFEVYSMTPFSYPAGNLTIDKTEADIAIYVLSRVAGENADRYEKKGDYYLSDEEAQLLEIVCTLNPNFVLVLNTGGQVDLSFVDAYENIRAILQISQLGCEGGNGFADVLSGRVTPSGKLVDTWTFHYGDYPNSATFSHNNGNVEKEYYQEGIYVGYRYFDTFEIPVRYGFGFGLSYTDFSIDVADIRVVTSDRTGTGNTVRSLRSDEITTKDIAVTVSVKNTGEREGKETVQIYVSCPQERMKKEYRRLVAFAKTPCLHPGDSVDMKIAFGAYDLASYCEKTPGWVLEKGIYGIFVGNSLESAVLAGSIQITEDELLVKTEHICPVKESFEELEGPTERVQKRRNAWLAQTASLPCVVLHPDDFSAQTTIYGKMCERIPDDVKAFVDSLSLDHLIQ